MENLAEIQSELSKALQESTQAQKAYDEALAKLEPLKDAAESKRNAVAVLIGQFQAATNTAPVARGRRGGVRGERKTYNITPESKVAATIKRSETRAKKNGMSDKDAKKAGIEAGKLLAQKLGVK